MARLLLILSLLLVLPAFGNNSLPVNKGTPAMEKRVLAIAEELRCLVCQNQTIADSNAELAVDLKNQIREKLTQGMADKEVVEFMVQRYGDFVLYRPPVKSSTWLLWFGPFMLLGGGLIFLGLKLRGSGKSTEDRPNESVPAADRQKAAALLDAKPEAGEKK